jgi:hypothetical protein
MTVTQLAQPGAAPQQSASQMFRAPDGKMRVDSGTTSVITDPSAKQAIVLDHVKKIAHAIPMPQMPSMPQFAPPGMPAVPGMPSPPVGQVHVQDLGKAMIEGHEVDGKKFTFQPPQTPQAPQMPPMPQAPDMPASPGTPQPPAMPQAPKPPVVSEVWTSSKLHMPVLTKTTGEFGEQVCHCKCTGAVPPPAMFQIPPGYKMVKAG